MTPLQATLRGSVLALLLSAVGCQPPTSFEGEAKFPGGARGCYERCAADNMEMASFVYVGEYSTACACQPKRTGPGATSEADRASSAMVAAAAGAELQRRRIAAQRASANQSLMMQTHR